VLSFALQPAIFNIPTAASVMKSISLFDFLILGYVLVHLNFEYRLWLRRDSDLLARYSRPGRSALRTASLAYWAKALWLVLLVVMQYGGVPFREAFVTSFLLYAVIVQILTPLGAFSVIQVIIGLACLVEQLWFRR
jgi:hypothetical protein